MVVVFSSLSVPPSMSSSPLPSIIYLVLSPLRVFSRCLPQCNIHLALNPLHPPGPRVGPHDKVLFLCNLCLKNGKLKLHLIAKSLLGFPCIMCLSGLSPSLRCQAVCESWCSKATLHLVAATTHYGLSPSGAPTP